MSISVVIPTYGRDRVLVDSVAAILPASEVIVVDQTPRHDEETTERLADWNARGAIRWLRLKRPSIPHAMNIGLRAARHDVVLFLDDDILPGQNLLGAHVDAHDRHNAVAVVGQVLQPGEEPAPPPGPRTNRHGFRADLDFPFWSNEPAWVSNVMAGNLSVRRQTALRIGGFDENFSGSAFRFETEFARRLIAKGGKIRFEPRASIRHLRAERGGTRTSGNHLASASPNHGMGDYYFALRSGWSRETAAHLLMRPFREVSTRFHARRPWWIPVKLIGECRALLAAINKHRRGPALIPEDQRTCDSHS